MRHSQADTTAARAGLGYVPGWAIYLAWSLWLGFRLRGSAPEAALRWIALALSTLAVALAIARLR